MEGREEDINIQDVKEIESNEGESSTPLNSIKVNIESVEDPKSLQYWKSLADSADLGSGDDGDDGDGDNEDGDNGDNGDNIDDNIDNKKKKNITDQEVSGSVSESRRSGKTSGRWGREEHKRFVEGLKIHGKDWKKVEEYIGTRTGAQIRSHAQKFFNRIQKEFKVQDPLSMLCRGDILNIDMNTPPLSSSAVIPIIPLVSLPPQPAFYGGVPYPEHQSELPPDNRTNSIHSSPFDPGTIIILIISPYNQHRKEKVITRIIAKLQYSTTQFPCSCCLQYRRSNIYIYIYIGERI